MRTRQAGIAGVLSQSQGHAVRRGGADEGRAPHHHVGDGPHRVLQRVQSRQAELVRQQRLVDDLDRDTVGVQTDGAMGDASDVHIQSRYFAVSGPRRSRTSREMQRRSLQMANFKAF